MIYMLLAVTIPFLAARGIDTLLDQTDKEETFKKVLYVAGGIGGITMILIMFGDGLFSFSGAGDSRYNNPGFITKLRSSRIELYNK